MEQDGSWRSNIPIASWFFSLFCLWVWSFMHQMSELRVGFLFWGGLVDHDDRHSRPRCVFEGEGGVNFLWVSWRGEYLLRVSKLEGPARVEPCQ